jgi:glucosamine--fructose-6-phosphate aminotransferase (isomerizing)
MQHDSRIALLFQFTVPGAGEDEKSMVMTRSFTSMLISLQYLAGCWAENTQFIQDLRRMAEHFAPRIHSIAELTEAFVQQQSFADYVFLGQGPFHGIAREASLKSHGDVLLV